MRKSFIENITFKKIIFFLKNSHFSIFICKSIFLNFFNIVRTCTICFFFWICCKWICWNKYAICNKWMIKVIELLLSRRQKTRYESDCQDVNSFSSEYFDFSSMWRFIVTKLLSFNNSILCSYNLWKNNLMIFWKSNISDKWRKYFDIFFIMRSSIDLICSCFKNFLIITTIFNDSKFVCNVLNAKSIWLIVMKKH